MLPRCDSVSVLIAVHSSQLESQSHLEKLSHSHHVALGPGGKQENPRHGPPALASLHCCVSQCLAYTTLQIALLFCSSLIGFGVVFSSARSQHNDSFNWNHEKLCAQSGRAAHLVRDDDVLSCMDTVFACSLFKSQICPCWSSEQIDTFKKMTH